MAILQLSSVATLTILITVGVYLLESRCQAFSNLPYMAKQVIIGSIFGALAVFGTEFGVPYEGAMINIRDAAPVCAGLVFGGPAGVIAGLIGGIERWLAVYWGVGMYTRVACAVGTLFAGVFAAFVRKFLMDDRKSSSIYAFAVAFVAEVFHMLMVFLTHMDDYVYALTVVRHCAPVMIIMVSLTCLIASLIVNIAVRAKSETMLGSRNEKKGIAQTIGMALFVTVSIASIIMIGFVVVYQDSIANQQAKVTITNALDDVEEDIKYAVDKTENTDEVIHNATRNRRIGNDGIIIISDSENNIIGCSASSDEAAEYKISRNLIRDNIERIETLESGRLYSWTSIGGKKFHCMIKTVKGYRIFGFYPMKEANVIKWSSIYLTAFSIVIILAAIFIQIYFLIKKIIIGNIREINGKLARITEGNLDTVIEAGGTQEFISLSDDINTTVDTLKHYIKEAEGRIDKELEFARSIQYSALNRDFPESNHFGLFAIMDTAKEVGGDFYDFYKLGDDREVILIADVAGKGIPASLFMMQAKTLIKSLVESGMDVATVLTKANEELCRNNDAEMFLTAWLGILDLNTNIVTYANAGHNRPVIVRGTGEAEFIDCRSGFVLAGMEGIKYKSEELQLNSGDGLLLYTDGVTEAVNAKGELYGDDRLIDELKEVYGMVPRHACDYIMNSINEFVGDAPQADDITMLALRMKDESDKEKSRVVVPNRDSVEEVESYFEYRCSRLGVSMKTESKINIIIDEIYSNIVYYSGATIARLSLLQEGEDIILIFKDNGIEYNPLEKDDPDISLSAEDRNIGGLGIFMVKKMASRMDYTRVEGRNTTTVVIKDE